MQSENLGIDFFNKRNSYVKSVTKKQIDALVKEYLKPENLHIVVSGG
jgi:predicted Zn-dependent peptidase